MDIGPIGPQYGPPGTGPAHPPEPEQDASFTQGMSTIVPPQYQTQPPMRPMDLPPPAGYVHAPYPWLGGSPAASAMAQSNVTNIHLSGRRGVNHALHGTLTVLTCGLWAPVWIALAIMNPRR